MKAIAAANAPLGGAGKAAVLVIVLGEQCGSELIRHLSAEEVAQLGQTVTAMQAISSSQAEEVLQEYVQMTQARQYVLRGGADYARRMLTGALGEDGASKMIDRFSQPEETSQPAELTRIESAEPQQLAALLQAEHPQATAIVLSRLTPARAAGVLQAMPATLRADIALRLANLDRVSPDVMSKIADVIGKKLQAASEMTGSKSGGIRVIADVFNNLDSALAEELLGVMEETDANVTELVRHHMFVFEDILRLGQEALKEIVGKTDRAILTVALKGTSEQMKNAVMACMSQRGADMLREDMEAAGPARIRDVEQAQRQVIELVRQLQRDGVIGNAGEQYVV
jgi:flagellar motor switch protein FliG